MIKEGSLYPALHRMKKDGLLNIDSVHIAKRIRRYYSLTEHMKQETANKLEEIDDFVGTLNKLLE